MNEELRPKEDPGAEPYLQISFGASWSGRENHLTDPVGRRKSTASLKAFRPFLAALLLIAWLFASAHMAQEHGGDLARACATCALCHDGDSGPVGDHHHHDLGAVPAEKTVGAQKIALTAVAWTPLHERLRAQFAALLRQAAAALEPSTFGNSPPDERASGWLFVSHTALPVRGPSFA